MPFSYFKPLSDAWQRMVRALFKPFDINKWFALGFTAFLAELLDWEDDFSSHDYESDDGRLDNILEAIRSARRWLLDNPEWFALIVTGIILIIAILTPPFAVFPVQWTHR